MKFFASMFVILALFISTGAWAITITDTGSAAYWGGELLKGRQTKMLLVAILLLTP
jgi:hypothetical protein